MVGINANGGGYLDGVERIEQSLGKIITTLPGERVRREWFGNPGLFLLGKNMTEDNILRFFAITWALIELYEPGFECKLFDVESLERGGVGDFQMYGNYRIYAHLDWEQAAAFVSLDNDTVTINSI